MNAEILILEPEESALEKSAEILSKELLKDPLGMTNYILVLPSRRSFLFLMRKVSIISGIKTFPLPKHATPSDLPFLITSFFTSTNKKAPGLMKPATFEDRIKIAADFTGLQEEEIKKTDDLLWLGEIASSMEKLLQTNDPFENELDTKLCHQLNLIPVEDFVKNSIVKKFWEKAREKACAKKFVSTVIEINEKNRAYLSSVASLLTINSLKENTECLRDKKVLMMGINFITPLQRLLLKTLIESTKEAYIVVKKVAVTQGNPNHPIVKNLRALLETVGKSRAKEELTKTAEKIIFPKVKEIFSPSRISVSKYVAKEILKEASTEPDKLSVVVPEDNSLELLILAIEEEAKKKNTSLKINISMGLPASRSSTYSLLIKTLRFLQESKTDGKALSFPTERILPLVESPLMGDSEEIKSVLKLHLATQDIELETLEKILKASSSRQWKSLWSILKEFLLNRAEISLEEASSSVLDFIKKIYEENFKSKEQKDPLKEESAFLSTFVNVLKSIRTSVLAGLKMPPLEAFSYLLWALEGNRTPFSGEPLSGTQVLGLLETRSLDFDKIIFLDTHEGSIPNTRKSDPVIPAILRKNLGLMDPKTESAIYEANFFSLVLEAKEVILSYTDAERKSRFLEKMKYMMDLSGQRENYQEHSIVSGASPEWEFLNLKETGVPVVGKDRSIHPTLVENYKDCPLRAFLSEVIKANPEDTILLSSAILGTLAHLLMEKIYREASSTDSLNPMIETGEFEKTIENSLKKLKKKLPATNDILEVAKVLLEDFGKDRDTTHVVEALQNTPKPLRVLAAKIMWYKIEKILSEEKIFLHKNRIRSLKILGLEKELSKKVDLNESKNSHTSDTSEDLTVKGKSDRIQIEQKEDECTINVIDYKTGGYAVPRDIDKIIEDLKSFEEESFFISKTDFLNFLARKAGSLQLLLYLWMLLDSGLEQHGSAQITFAHTIYSLKKGTIVSKKAHRKEIEKACQCILKPVLRMMIGGFLSPSPTKYNICSSCPYRWICKTEKTF